MSSPFKTRAPKPRLAFFATLLSTLLMVLPARAGGLEYPDNGSESMGRGATFTAKADDGSALMYNVAGFARQRGMRLTLGTNVAFHSATFQRAGTYPDDPNDPFTPWGGKPFPLVKNKSALMPIPHLVLSHDLGTDRFTVAAGVYAPSVIPRSFPLTIDHKPSPARYDSASDGSGGGNVILYPTLAAAYRVAPWLDVGAAVNFVLASVNTMNVTSADLAKAVCPQQEYQPCDSQQMVKATGGTVAFTFGTLVRPEPWLAIGLQLRTPHTIEMDGTVDVKAPRVQPNPIAPGQASISMAFPWIARGGVRYIGLKDKREVYDIEADVTYEAWSALATKIYIPKLSVFENVRTSLNFNFRDTMSFRLGGAYNLPLSSSPTDASVVSVRAGVYHDLAATKEEDTRLGFDSVAKTGLTVGAGIKSGPVMVNIALAKIFHETREVTSGEARPINGSQGGKPIDSAGDLYAPVNNGTFTASTWVVSTGITVQLDELFSKKRVPEYGADYEITTKDLPRSPRPVVEEPNDDEAKRKGDDSAVASTKAAPSSELSDKPRGASESVEESEPDLIERVVTKSNAKRPNTSSPKRKPKSPSRSQGKHAPQRL